MEKKKLDAACRVAFAALIHDLGKFYQRTGLVPEKLDEHITLYARYHKQGNYHSHLHAAYTAIAFDELEKQAPDLIQGEMTPFSSRKNDDKNLKDSLVNASAMHHQPDSFLQWVIATADRVASGFEREKFDTYNDENEDEQLKKAKTQKNYISKRLLTLFEQIKLNANKTNEDYRYPLLPLSVDSIFPKKATDCEVSSEEKAKEEYKKLWKDFLEALEEIPKSHRSSWPLWLDHFDTAWMIYTQAIPSATFPMYVKPEISLYDHSKTTAALATALWNYHEYHEGKGDGKGKVVDAVKDWSEKKFLIILGDFFGIQDFIFAEGSQTNKQAAKILRGRSLHVSLLSELAALTILEKLNLPSTSQILNAAGKFWIVAENTEEVIEKLKDIQKEFNDWFIKETYGVSGVGLAWVKASCEDLSISKDNNKKQFSELKDDIFSEIEKAKLQRLGLCQSESAVLPLESFDEPCAWHGRMPANGETEGKPSSAFTRDQLLMGERLVKQDRLLILNKNDKSNLKDSDKTKLCELDIFNYSVAFTETEEITGRFANLVKEGSLRRCWDFALPNPNDFNKPLWNGYARRNINGYVPYFSEGDREKLYQGVDEKREQGKIKTLNHIACEDRLIESDNKVLGIVALATLKGDVDNLGRIFKDGLQNATFAKMASLSRQMNNFFSVYLPYLCATKYPDTYTVFAGGDDFFLIGPWHKTQSLAYQMADDFKRYVANNPEIHFSAGLVMTKPGFPVTTLARVAEDALDMAKQKDGKNAVNLFTRVITWDELKELFDYEKELENIQDQYKLSQGYLYSLFFISDMAEDAVSAAVKNIESCLWRSQLVYKTARALKNKQKANKVVENIGSNGIEKYKGNFRIPLSNYFYRKRRKA